MPPKAQDVAVVPGVGEWRVGEFWKACKYDRRCAGPLYDRLLDNPVLREDYRGPPPRHCGSWSAEAKVRILRPE